MTEHNHAWTAFELDVLDVCLKDAMSVAAETNDGVVLRARAASSLLHVIAELRASRKVVEAYRQRDAADEAVTEYGIGADNVPVMSSERLHLALLDRRADWSGKLILALIELDAFKPMTDLNRSYAESLAEKVKESREDLARFPLWLTTGSQRDYDEWMLGREPSIEEKVRRITELRGK